MPGLEFREIYKSFGAVKALRGVSFAVHGGEAHRQPARAPWGSPRHSLFVEADTPAGRAFDLALLVAILVSIVAVMLESVAAIRRDHGGALRALEWTITALFTVEYALRLIAVERPGRYARSFLGLVDLLAILPTYLALVTPEAHSLLVIRSLRLLRIFRILKLAQFLGEAQLLLRALRWCRAMRRCPGGL